MQKNVRYKYNMKGIWGSTESVCLQGACVWYSATLQVLNDKLCWIKTKTDTILKPAYICARISQKPEYICARIHLWKANAESSTEEKKLNNMGVIKK